MTEDRCSPSDSLPTPPPQVQTHLVVPLRKPWAAFYWHRQICPERQANAHKYDDRCTLHIVGMERSAPGVPDPAIMSKHKMHACTGTHACRHTFETVVEMKCKNQDNNKSKRTVKRRLCKQKKPGSPPESLGRTSTLQASLVVSEMVEP